MGHGNFDTTASSARATMRMSTGTSAFTHDADVKSGRASKALHDSMDLSKKPRRECRDNDDNPRSTPIAIFVDVTGSMGSIAGYIIDNAHKAVSAIRDKGAVEYPSILFGAVGDAYSDQVPIQVGEFESSDELAEKHLANIYREGNGGGQNMESYDLALWFTANQVDTDAWDKRGEKGFLFITGDEAPYPVTRATHVAQHCGATIGEDILTETTLLKLDERWHVFLLRPGGTSCYGDPHVKAKWLSIMPAERVIDVPDWNEIVSVIAGTVSLISGQSLDSTLAALKDSGLSTTGISTALATVASSASLAVAGSTDLASAGSHQGATRL